MQSAPTSCADRAPSVSVVIPAYNAMEHLVATCGSILSQTLAPIEVLIVDDHSTDGTHAAAFALAKQDPRVKVLQTSHNCGGPAGPRNLGIRHALGDYVAFCDSDDLWLDGKLELQMQVIRETGATLCASQAQRFSDESELQRESSRNAAWNRITFYRNRVKNRIVTSSVVAKRTELLRHPFNENAGYRAVEDYDCWLRLLHDGAFCAKLEQPLVGYRICDTQISRDKWQMVRKVFRVHWNFNDKFGRVGAPVFAATHATYGLAQRAFGLSV